eukprot:scaffold13107_cov140-Isochrysis_galbana.AAC.2
MPLGSSSAVTRVRQRLEQQSSYSSAAFRFGTDPNKRLPSGYTLSAGHKRRPQTDRSIHAVSGH